MKKTFTRSKILSVISTLFFLLSFHSHSVAQLVPSKIFASGMVLQRNMDIPIWGTTSADDSVFISFNSIIDTAVADANGKWKITFPAMIEGGPYQMSLRCKTEIKNFTDVYIGDVWLCSGQSNMELMVSQANNSAATIAAANSQTIRQCKIDKALANEPSTVLNSATWLPATSANVGNFSAAAYYFARDIQPYINNVPIGIINVSYGGSRIETWMSDEMLGYDESVITLAAGESERQPTVAFNKMINPIIGVPIKGFLWYQGESNADYMQDAIVYGEQFKTMITEWRKLWNLGDIPFIWVQLPNQGLAYDETNPQSWDTWPILRATQSRALSLPNTAEVVTIDIGEVDIHPKDKESLGARIALAARELVYGETIVSKGPRYKSYTLLPNGSVQIEFDNIGSGLLAKDTTNGELSWFSMADANGTLKKADAIISGNSVIVSNPTITNPAIVRYAWEYNPVGVNFYNQENLPAAPFKITVNNEGFKIKTFGIVSNFNDFKINVNDTIIQRGQSIHLKWEVCGASKIMINGIEKDSLSAIQLWPMDTIAYIITAVNKYNNLDTLRDTINTYVINPLPTIILSAKMGNVSPPNEEVTIIADAKAPGGGTVKQVEFYIDGTLLIIDSEAPYETTWTPTALGNYEITGLVINTVDDSTWSIKYTMYVNNLTRVRFEAEKAVRTGTGISVVTSSLASNNRYLKVQEPFTISFNNIQVDTAGIYQVNIHYLMSFDPTKEQFLYVNGVLNKTIRFTAPDTQTWMDYSLMVQLNAGTNEIMLKNSWGWMSFDYIDILGANPISNILPITSNSKTTLSCNSDSGITTISYTIPKDGNIKIELLDVTGQSISKVVYGYQSKGTYTTIVKQKLEPGVYVAKLTCNGTVVTQKIVIK